MRFYCNYIRIAVEVILNFWILFLRCFKSSKVFRITTFYFNLLVITHYVKGFEQRLPNYGSCLFLIYVSYKSLYMLTYLVGCEKLSNFKLSRITIKFGNSWLRELEIFEILTHFKQKNKQLQKNEIIFLKVCLRLTTILIKLIKNKVPSCNLHLKKKKTVFQIIVTYLCMIY